MPAALQSPLQTQVTLSRDTSLNLTCKPDCILLWEAQQQQLRQASHSLPSVEHVAQAFGPLTWCEGAGMRRLKN